MFAIVARRGLENLGEPWTPEAIVGWEIRATVKGLSVGRQEHRQGPTSTDPEHLHHMLVDLVEVWALLTVDLDIHKMPIHDLGDGFGLEGFALHHMAPMAGGVANAEQNGFVLRLGLRQSFLTPGVPIHRIMGMLEEVRARLMNQAVGLSMFHRVALFLLCTA